MLLGVFERCNFGRIAESSIGRAAEAFARTSAVLNCQLAWRGVFALSRGVVGGLEQRAILNHAAWTCARVDRVLEKIWIPASHVIAMIAVA